MAMLRQVTSEAVAIGRIVQPRRVADPSALTSAGKWLAGCSLALLGFLAFDWPQTSVLLRRFWSPLAEISATSLVSSTGDLSVPRGDFVDLVAASAGLPRKSALLTIARTGSKPETIELATDAKRANTFAYRMQVEDSFQYRVRAGDGQTAWHTVTVIDYPALAEVRFIVIAPTYLNRPNVDKTMIPGRIKVMQGSMLQLQMRPKASLERLELAIAPDAEPKDNSAATSMVQALTADANGWYRFQMQLMENMSLSPSLWNSHGLTNEDHTVCRIQVMTDSAPVARVLTPTTEMAVATDDVIDIKFEAHDDHGIARAELVIYDESATEEGKPAPILKVMPIPLGDQELERHVIGIAQLDLKQLNLKPGTQISYAVRVTDNRIVSQDPSATSPMPAPSREPDPQNADFQNAAMTNQPSADAKSKADLAGSSSNVRPQDTKQDSTTAASESAALDSAEPVNSAKNASDKMARTSPNADAQAPASKSEATSDSKEAKKAAAEDATPTADTKQPAPATNTTESALPADAKSGRRPNQNADSPEESVPPIRMLAMAPQQSESGQNAETNRGRLKITERLSAVAESRKARNAETSNVRDKVVEIDALLADVEEGLTRVVNREIPDDDRSPQFKILDTQLGDVEAKISDLRKKTRDEQFAFVGLQMVDIGRSHVTPARERVFVAIREPATEADSSSRGALQQVIRARELLAALLKRYDRVARDQQLAQSLNQGVKMYEVYVEKMQQLMREARQNRNPLERKMAVIEVDQDYLDRYAEVLTMRREMLAESWPPLLSDDPRLLARYLDLVKRRRSFAPGPAIRRFQAAERQLRPN